MSDPIAVIQDKVNIRSRAAALAAEPGSIAIENIAGSLKQVDDQGTATALGGAGSGTVTSVAATASGLLAVAGTPTVAPTVGMASMADQRIVGNVSGGAAVPIALTAAQVQTMLSVQASNNVAITGGSITGLTTFTLPGSLATGILSVTTTTGAVASTAITTGAVPFGVSSILSQDATNFVWDNTVKALGIGTNAPNIGGAFFGANDRGLTIVGASTGGGYVIVQRTTASTTTGVIGGMYAYNGANNTGVFTFGADGAADAGRAAWFTKATGGALTERFSISGAGAILCATGTKIGFYGATPPIQQTATALTNSVTSGGSTDVIADYSSLTVYSTDAAAIRNNFYQLARKLGQIVDGLRTFGLFAN